MTDLTNDAVIVQVGSDTPGGDVVEKDVIVVIEPEVPEVIVLDQSSTSSVMVQEDVVTVFADRCQTEVVEVGAVGPQGPPGTSSGATSKVAAVAVGGHRAVILNEDDEVDYADNQVLAHRNLLFGITTGAASAGDEAEIATSGEVTEPSWNWTPQAPIFLGTNGLLTQTTPVAPAVFSRIIAFAVNATSIVVGFREPIAIA